MFFKLTWSFLSLAALFVMSLAPHPGVAEEETTLAEYHLKAGFLLNFIKLTDFHSESPPLKVCIFAPPEHFSAFAPLEEQRINGFELPVVFSPSLQEAKLCTVVFLSQYYRQQTEVLQAITGAHALSVGESPEFLESGGIIRFFTEKEKIRFEVHLANAKAAGLELSSRLLRLAKIVQPREVKQ